MLVSNDFRQLNDRVEEKCQGFDDDILSTTTLALGIMNPV